MNNFLILLLLFISCKGNSNKQKKSIISETNQEKLADCIHQKDTLINTNLSISYPVSKDFFGVKIRIGAQDTLLNYQFNCSTPAVLVPVYYKHSSNLLVLKRGQANHFREIIVCSLINDKIIIKRFESERSMDAVYDFVYKLSNTDSFLIVASLTYPSKTKRIKIPQKVSQDSIRFIKIRKEHIVIVNENKTELSINL